MFLNNTIDLNNEVMIIEWINEVSRLFGNIITATAALDFPSVAAGSYEDLTITVTGAVANDAVVLGLPTAPTAQIGFEAFVSAADTVTVRATNNTAGAIDPASATYRVTVIK